MNHSLKCLSVVAIICAGMLTLGNLDQATKDALKVQHILKTIEQAPPRSDGKKMHAEVTEPELNAYVAYRLKMEKNTAVKNLRIWLLEKNHVQGKLKMNAKQLGLDMLFGDLVVFDFKGIVHTKKGSGRLELTALDLNGQVVGPQMVELVLKAVALYYGEEPIRPGDWQPLPKGIERIVVDRAKAVLIY